MEFGAGTTAYGMVAGLSFALGFTFLVLAARRRPAESVTPMFAVFCLAVGANALTVVRLQRSTTVDEYGDLLQLYGAVALVSLVAAVGLVLAWARTIPIWLTSVFFGLTFAVAVAQLVTPNGLLAGEITGLRDVELLGEPFVVHDGTNSPWRPLLDVYLAVAILAIGLGLVRGMRGRDRRIQVSVAVGSAVVIAVGLFDSLVDEGLVSSPYVGPFGVAGVVLLGAWLLATRLADTEARLSRQTVELEAIVIERTGALIEANEQLERQLERQRTSARQLATLTEQVERVNSLTLDHDESRQLEASLHDVLRDLGHLTGVEQVTMNVADLDERVPIQEEIGWERSDDTELTHEWVQGDDGGTVISEPLLVGGHRIGELNVVARSGPLDDERRRYVDLTAGHLAGFLGRLELAGQITADAIDDERRRIARELHDSVTQHLYSAAFLADAASGQLAVDPPSADQTVRRLREILMTSLAELRTLMYELHPIALETATLDKSLGELASSYHTVSPISVVVAFDESPDLPPAAKVGLYRIAQEALTNVARHAGTDSAAISLERVDDGVRLTVSDDGRGFDADTPSTGCGIRNLRERAKAIGAELSVRSVPGCGTTVRAQWSPPTRSTHGEPTVGARPTEPEEVPS